MHRIDPVSKWLYANSAMASTATWKLEASGIYQTTLAVMPVHAAPRQPLSQPNGSPKAATLCRGREPVRGNGLAARNLHHGR